MKLDKRYCDRKETNIIYKVCKTSKFDHLLNYYQKQKRIHILKLVNFLKITKPRA